MFYHQVSVHSIRLPKNSTVGDVLNDIKTKVSIYYPYFVFRYTLIIGPFAFVKLTYIFYIISG
jgi:hypothetical protein